MKALYISHSDCEKHLMSERHPESPLRLQAIESALNNEYWDAHLDRQKASEIDESLFRGIHPKQYLDRLAELRPGEGIANIDADTAINKHSLRAARLAAGAGIAGVESVMASSFETAFCAVRPPGHHAESAIGMGFCIFNSIALAAERALSLGAERVAILDFDVHHGNGTVEIFQHRPEVLVCSSFQYPFYPGRFDEVSKPNICLSPLPEGTGSSTFRQTIERDWQAALQAHHADIILVSAGFDAHRDDPLANLLLEDEDYYWLGQFICNQAGTLCEGRVVSMLEGGYNTQALARSVTQYLCGLGDFPERATATVLPI
jgi:acetoin utilization deacetylase AcuC-like enzyme